MMNLRVVATVAGSVFMLMIPILSVQSPLVPLGGAASETLAREPLLTPDELGDGSIDGLQFADPTEGLVLISPPVASNSGDAQISYPLILPPGRGLTPELALSYNSGGGNGWLGLSWDLGVNSIQVDTRWGAPHFDPDKESETYLIDGKPLVPNALGDDWVDRVKGDRQDYTRRVETDYEQIIRHSAGDGGPDDYYWEVHDKLGNVRWYGGHPDDGGPDGEILNDKNGDPLTIDRSAIVYDENGNAFKWLLSAERDVGVNMIRYHYETIKYRHTSTGWIADETCTSSSTALCARHTYLRRIDYTAAANKSGEPEDPAYQVHFLLESDLNPTASARTDLIVDAIGGYLDLTIERLVRVEVLYGEPNGSNLRTYDQTAVRYDLAYFEASEVPFGKSLLRSVTQVADPVSESATHTFEYHNRVLDAGVYTGFETRQQWDAGDDILIPDLPFDTSVDVGALGVSTSVSGEGHAYVGFNAAAPTKTGSVGGSAQVSAGVTTALSEWLDINGDSLPDKVFTNGIKIQYRANQGGANGTNTFGPVQDVPGLWLLSSRANFGFQIAAEAHLGVTAAFGLGGDVSVGAIYFTDVNADGLPDLVAGPGLVFYNHMENGNPTFVFADSGDTAVPLPSTVRESVSLPQLTDLKNDLAEQSPLVDTVRRWQAPYTGTVSIESTVTLSPPGPLSPVNDGVRVAIQQNNLEILSAVLDEVGESAFGSTITRPVTRGDAFYFRVGSIENGGNDEVEWSPTITYTSIAGVADMSTVPPDINGLSQTVYSTFNDFTLSGRPNTFVGMPFEGTVRFEGTVIKLQTTTDDLRLVLMHDENPVPGSNITIPAGFVGEFPITIDFDVDAPVLPTEANQISSADVVHAHLEVDNPIDLGAVEWMPTLIYTAAVNDQGEPVDVGSPDDPRIKFDINPEVEQYPNRSTAGISIPWVATSSDTFDAFVAVNRGFESPEGEAIVSIRTRTGVVAKSTIFLPPAMLPTTMAFPVDLDAVLTQDAKYWFDVTIRDPNLSDSTDLTGFVLRPDSGSTGISVPATLHWTGRQGVFPLAYRGWAVAGYTANGSLATEAIDETVFEIDLDDFPGKTDAPTGFDDLDDEPPTPLPYVFYTPVVAPMTLPGEQPALAPSWRGTRNNLAASADRMRSSLLMADSAAIANDTGTGRGVPRIGLAAPSAALRFGIGSFGGSLGLAPSFGLLDYEDINGDGFPEVIVTPGLAWFTTQRGKFRSLLPSLTSAVFPNQNVTVSAEFGNNNLVDIKNNPKGKTNATKGSGAGKGDDASDSGSGVTSFGGSLNASWTSPDLSQLPDVPLLGEAYSTLAPLYEDLVGEALEWLDINLPLQQALVDINGDRLPDLVVAKPHGVFVHYNLGYSFTAAEVMLSTGAFESRESYGGSISLGYAAPDGSYSAGGAISTNLDLARYSWRDVNGDGVLDEVFNPVGSLTPSVAFGTGSGVLPPVEYGDMERATVVGDIQLDEQISLDSSIGVNFSGDFTIPIGPLCVVACYVIVNPGGSAQVSFSSPEVDLQDVDGDGYPDSVSTTANDTLWVRSNAHADTNLLRKVSNPLGGDFTLKYKREGNTSDHPGSVWTLSRVDVDDGRPGDGADIRTTSYEYSGLKYDRLHRESLGFESITEHELDTTALLEPAIRKTVREFLNDNVFVAGLEKSLLISNPTTGDSMRGSDWTWAFRDVRNVPNDYDVHEAVTPVDASLLGDLTGVPSLGMSVAPLLVRVAETWFDAGSTPGEQTRMDFTYDGLGNILAQTDHGETEDPNDNLVATFEYSRCDNGSSDLACVNPAPPKVSPLWSDSLCPTWVSLPVEFTITNGKSGSTGHVYRHRDGRTAICDNASITLLEEDIGNGAVAVTELNYDEWGSYDRIVYPTGADGRRYAVQYEYDDDRHSDIAIVREFDLNNASAVELLALKAGDPVVNYVQKGLESSATFDPLTGRVLTRTDANDNVTSYTYDSLARIKSISSPRPGDPDLVTYEYAPTDDKYAYAVAHHYDAFNPGDTIDTVTFVDGTGRTTQTKRDASLFVTPGQAAVTGRIVSGATNFDALGRAIEQFNPTRDTKAPTVYETLVPTGPVTTTAYDLSDRPTNIVEPGVRVTTIAYEFGKRDDDGPQLYRTTVTDPRLRQEITFTNVREAVTAIDDQPDGLVPLRTVFDYDGMGQLLRVVDSAGNETNHTYDMLGRRIATATPDAGLVEFGFDEEGKVTSKVTPNLRAAGEEIVYSYELGRLVTIDYPAGTPDVTYTYGTMGAPNNGAGRVVQSEDGSRIVEREFNPAGAVVLETAEIKLHAWHNPGTEPALFRWTTTWSYDGLARLEAMVYPDGERLTYDYDSGGLIKNIVGEEDGFKFQQNKVGKPVLIQVPHTWSYEYLRDQQNDEFLHRRYQEVGNGATSEYSYDSNTQWLTRQQTLSPNRKVKDPANVEIQDLEYTYDSVGNPLTCANNLPGPVPNLFGGATTQDYNYDGYDRIVSATGAWEQATNKLRHYNFAIDYDEHGNAISKVQTDDIFNGKKDLEQKKTTYSFDREYGAPAPHQATAVGRDTFHYDANGNLTGIKDRKGKYIRRIEWDASDRMRVVTDGPSSTTYQYDDTGQRTIERGPAGETAFINPWVTVRNRNEIFKHIWAGDDRIATQRDDGGHEELKRYFLHKDLQGSTNMVTDYRGDTFQHHEYFPTGQVWVDESSTVFRTPYQYGGGYVDEVREILNFGSRWYDQNREMFYSPDPILIDDPLAVIDDPGLSSAYTYAGSSPLTFIDPTGLQRTRAQALRLSKAEIKRGRKFFKDHPKQAAAVAKTIKTKLPRFLVKYAFNIKIADKVQSFSDFFDAKPLIEFDRGKGTLKLSVGFGKRLKFPLNKSVVSPKDSDSTSNNATEAGGRVNVGNQTQPQTGGTGVQAPEPPPAPENPRPPPRNRPPVANGDDGGARGDQ
jgi:RHS repeat-associated protein